MIAETWNAEKWIAVAALGAVLLGSASAAAGIERPRPSDVPGAETTMAPNAFQVYNDYASPERIYSSGRAVVHYVALGIDAPPLNDDDSDGVPDYVERVGDAVDRALAYYESRGFRRPLPDDAGPDHRPDIYVSRFAPGMLGVAFPGGRAEGGAFAVVSNNLDPSPERSFASVYATIAHELFHLVQFSYFGPGTDPAIPAWILEGPPPRSRRGSIRSWTISSRPSSCADGSTRPTGAWGPRATAPSFCGDGWTGGSRGSCRRCSRDWRRGGSRRGAAGRRRDMGARRRQSVRGRVPPVRRLRRGDPAQRRRARPRTPGPRSRPASPSAIFGLPCPARDARS